METDDGFEIVEQETTNQNPPIKNKKNVKAKEVKEPGGGNTDKPGLLMTNVSEDFKVQLQKDSVGILHSFHQNGRSTDVLNTKTKSIMQDHDKIKILLIKPPTTKSNVPDLDLMLKLFCEWSKAVFAFLGKTYPSGDYIAFIQDVQSKNIYAPCCHDIKPLQPSQLLNHFMGCLASKVDGSKCAFCNSTDLVANNYTTVNARKEHMTQNVHLNSIYLVLDYVATGLKMVDVRTCETYLLNRPFSNYFIKGDLHHYTYTGLLEFLKAHIPTSNIERSPLYQTFNMYKRLAINKKRSYFTIPCLDCDNTFPTYTGFYLGKILKLEQVQCQCEDGVAYQLPIAKIDEIYDMVRQLLVKDDSKAGKTLLLEIFQMGENSQKDGSTQINLINFNLDDLIKNSNTTTSCTATVVSGQEDATSGVTKSARASATLPVATVPKTFKDSTTTSTITINDSAGVSTPTSAPWTSTFTTYDVTKLTMQMPNTASGSASSGTVANFARSNSDEVEQSRKKMALEKPNNKVRIKDREITTTYSISSGPVIHPSSYFLRKMKINPGNKDAIDVVNNVYDRFMARIDTYDSRAHDALLERMQDTLHNRNN